MALYVTLDSQNNNRPYIVTIFDNSNHSTLVLDLNKFPWVQLLKEVDNAGDYTGIIMLRNPDLTYFIKASDVVRIANNTYSNPSVQTVWTDLIKYIFINRVLLSEEEIVELISSGVAGVATFNGRTGNVVLLSSDVTGALGYTPFPQPTGTITQYIRGDGSLALFPTALSQFTNDVGYITASSHDNLTNKTGLISMWTNDVGYITTGALGDYYKQGGNAFGALALLGTTDAQSLSIMANSVAGILLNGVAKTLSMFPNDTTGKVGINNSAPLFSLDVTGGFGASDRGYPTAFNGGFGARFYAVHGSGNWGFAITRAQNDTGGANLALYKTRNALASTYASAVIGDLIGRITWQTVASDNATVSVAAEHGVNVITVGTNYVTPYYYWNAIDSAGSNGTRMRLQAEGLYIGSNVVPTARLHIIAGTANPGTAPIKLTTGTLLTTTEDGALEYGSSHIYFTIGSTRYQLDQQTALGIPIGTTITGGTVGSVLFIGAGSTLAQDNTKFFWDDTNFRLGINNNTPTFNLDVTGTARMTTSLEVTSVTGITLGGGATALNYSAQTLQVGVGSTWTALTMHVSGIIKFLQNATTTTITNTNINLATANVQLAGVGVLKWTGTTLQFGSVDAGFDTLDFYLSGTQKMRLTSGGNLLIGTTTDAGDKLQVEGNARFGASGTTAIVSLMGTVATSSTIYLTRGDGVSQNYISVANRADINLRNAYLVTRGAGWSFSSGSAGDPSSYTINAIVMSTSATSAQFAAFYDTANFATLQTDSGGVFTIKSTANIVQVLGPVNTGLLFALGDTNTRTLALRAWGDSSTNRYAIVALNMAEGVQYDATKQGGGIFFDDRSSIDPIRLMVKPASGGSTPAVTVSAAGKVGIGVAGATAYLQIVNGTGAAGTGAIKLSTSVLLSVIEDGVLEYGSSHLWFSIGGTRYQLDQQNGIGSFVPGGTAGSVLFINPTNTLAQDNANFFWDVTNKALRIGPAPLAVWNNGYQFATVNATDGATAIVQGSAYARLMLIDSGRGTDLKMFEMLNLSTDLIFSRINDANNLRTQILTLTSANVVRVEKMLQVGTGTTPFSLNNPVVVNSNISDNGNGLSLFALNGTYQTPAVTFISSNQLTYSKIFADVSHLYLVLSSPSAAIQATSSVYVYRPDNRRERFVVSPNEVYMPDTTVLIKSIWDGGFGLVVAGSSSTQTADLLKVTNYNGTGNYFNVKASGDVLIGGDVDAGFPLDVTGKTFLRYIGDSQLYFDTQSSGGTALTMGYESGYNFYIRTHNGGQGLIQWDFSGLAAIQQNVEFIGPTAYLLQIFSVDTVFSNNVGKSLWFGEAAGTNDQVGTSTNTVVFNRALDGQYHNFTTNPAVSIFNGSRTSVEGNVYGFKAYWYRNGYIGIGTSNTVSNTTNPLRAALTINQGPLTGYANLNQAAQSQVVTVGSSTVVTFLPQNGNNVPTYGLIVGSIITANSVSRTVVQVAADSVIVDSAVDWSNGGLGYNFTYSNPYVDIANGATPYFYIAPSGNVLVGTRTDNPFAKFNVAGSGRVEGAMYVDRVGGNLSAYASIVARGASEGSNFGNPIGNGAVEITTINTAGMIIGTSNASPIVFGVGNTEKARFATNGNLGIGTGATVPLWQVTIKSPNVNTGVFTITNPSDLPTASFGIWPSGAGFMQLFNQSGTNVVQINGQSGSPTYFNSGSNIGVGTTTPAMVMDIVTGIGAGTTGEANSFRLRHRDNTSFMQLQMGVSTTGAGGNNNGYGYLNTSYVGAGDNTPLLLQTTGGSVGINTTSGVQYPLTVSGTIVTRTTSTTVGVPGGILGFGHMAPYTYSAFIAGIYDKASWPLGMGMIFATVSGSDISGVNGIERMRISSDGFVGIGTVGTLIQYQLQIKSPNINTGVVAIQNPSGGVAYAEGLWGDGSGFSRWYDSFGTNTIQLSGLNSIENWIMGRIGIGTNTPGASTKLQVNGLTLITGGTTNPGDGTPAGMSLTYETTTNGAGAYISALQTGVTWAPLFIQGIPGSNGNTFINTDGGKVVIGYNTTESYAKVEITDSAALGGAIKTQMAVINRTAGGTSGITFANPGSSWGVAMWTKPGAGWFEFGTLAGPYIRLFQTDYLNTAGALIGWSSESNFATPGVGARDTAIGRNAAGVLEINNGTAGTYRDLIVRTLTSTNLTIGNPAYLSLGVATANYNNVTFNSDASFILGLNLSFKDNSTNKNTLVTPLTTAFGTAGIVMGGNSATIQSSNVGPGDLALYAFTGATTAAATFTTDPRLIIKGATGSVGIGVVAPSYRLHVVQSTASLQFSSGNTDNIPTLSLMRTGSSGDVVFNLHSAGIGLVANGSGELRIATTSGGWFTTFTSNGVERMRISIAGRVLIGTTTDDTSGILQVAGNISTNGSAAGLAVFDRGGGGSAMILYNSGGTFSMFSSISGTDLFKINLTNGLVNFTSNGSSGNVVIGSSTNNGNRLQVYGNAFVQNEINLANGGYVVNNSLLTYISNGGGSAGYVGFGFTNTASPNISNTVFNIYQSRDIAPDNLFNFRHSMSNSTGNSAAYAIINVSTEINQTNGSNGVVWGILYNPTITAINGQHRALEIMTGDVIFSSGATKVGIGTVSPSVQLQIKMPSNNAAAYAIVNNNGGGGDTILAQGAWGSGAGFQRIGNSAGATVIQFSGDTVAGTNYITSGRFGVGTTAPNTLFHVAGSVPRTDPTGEELARFTTSDLILGLVITAGTSATANLRNMSIQSVEDGVAYRDLKLNPYGGSIVISETLQLTKRSIAGFDIMGLHGVNDNDFVIECYPGGITKDSYFGIWSNSLNSGSGDGEAFYILKHNSGAIEFANHKEASGVLRDIVFSLNDFNSNQIYFKAVTGYVGIGTTNPTTKLQIQASSGNVVDFSLSNVSNIALASLSTDSGGITYLTSYYAQTYNIQNSPYIYTWQAAGSTIMTLNNGALSIASNILVGNGTIAAPSIAFSNSTGSGFYFDGFAGDGVWVVDGGAQVASFRSTGIYANAQTLPVSDNAFALGSYNARWTKGFFVTLNPRGGSAAVPSYNFDDGVANSVNSGMYLPTSTSLGFSVTGTSIMTLNSSGMSLSGTLNANGIKLNYVTKVAAYTLTDNDYTVDCTTGTFTITLPDATTRLGQIYNVINSGAGTITVATTSSQTIGNTSSDPTSVTINPGSNMQIQSTGANWRIL